MTAPGPGRRRRGWGKGRARQQPVLLTVDFEPPVDFELTYYDSRGLARRAGATQPGLTGPDRRGSGLRPGRCPPFAAARQAGLGWTFSLGRQVLRLVPIFQADPEDPKAAGTHRANRRSKAPAGADS